VNAPSQPAPGGLRSAIADRSIATKLLTAMLVLTAIMVGVGTVGMQGMRTITRRADDIFAGSVVPLADVGAIRNAFGSVRTQALDHAASASSAHRAAAEQNIRTADAALDKAIAEVDSSGLTADQKAGIDKFIGLIRDYQRVRDDQLLPASRRGDRAAVERALDDLRPIAVESGEVSTALFNELEAQAHATTEDVDAISASRTRATLLLIAVAIALSIALALGLSRMLTGSINKVVAALDRTRAGDLTAVADVRSRDEVGRMAAALNETLERIRAAMGSIGASATRLTGSSERLGRVSEQLTGNADEASAQLGVVAAAAGEVSSNVETVAAGTEQMTASIAEIARSAGEAASVATSAVDLAQSSGRTVAKLGESSNEIAGVIKVITSIAEQTNLLALNATIEAARAGEAGKGFAVVAGEVKELAQETAKATEDIGRRIQAIQTDTGAAITAIDQIGNVISEINSSQTTIAGAVEEQAATTSEIGRSVSVAASGSNEIARNIASVSGTAQATTEGAGETRKAADDLAGMAGELRELVGQFTY
jgi:methyl-accepting chemotaxis protein